MSKMDLNEIVDRLIGHCNFVGETNYDEKSLNNIDGVSDLLNHLAEILERNVEDGKGCYESSIVKIREKSKKILEEIKLDIEDVL